MSEEFSTELKQFVTQHIESLAQLETLLLLRQDSSRSWSPAEVAKALYANQEMCANQLAELARHGFLEFLGDKEPRYRYQPSQSGLAALIDELAQTYQDRRVAVITHIYSKPVSKVQTFADSFRLRREG